MLSPASLLRRLDQRLSLLTGGAQDLDERQRTLRGTIEWSHELLLEDERALFARLGALVGGCRLEAAESLCDLGGALGTGVLDGLGSLVDKSLLRRTTDSDGEPRFSMLETIREYALEMLHASGEAEEAQRLHAMYYAEEAERLDLASQTGRPAELPCGRLDDDYANLSAAIDFARETRDGELMLRLVTALWGFWSTRGYVAEGRRALEDAFELADRRPPRAILGLCTLRVLSGTSEGVLDDAHEAMRASEEVGDDFSLAEAWNLVGRIEGGVMGRMRQAEQAFRNALSHAERGNYGAEKAEAIGWLLLSTVFGPTPAADGIVLCDEFAHVGARRSDDPGVVPRGARGSRGDARRVRTSKGVAGLRHTGTRGARADACGPRTRPRKRSSSRASRERRPPRRRRFASATGHSTGWASAACSPPSRDSWRKPSTPSGEYEEAARCSRASEDAAAPDDVFSQMLWRISRAKLLVRQGNHERAEALAREAVRLGEPTDLLNTQADALFDLAEVLRLGGQPEEAVTALGQAARLYEQKGNLPGLARARAFAADLSPASSSA